MRPDPALQARNSSSRFSILRALVAFLVLAALAILPAICRGADDGSCCTLPGSLARTVTSSSLALSNAATTAPALHGH